MRTTMACLLLAFMAVSSAHSAPKGQGDEYMPVEFCDLFHNPNEYDGKAVKVTATYELGIHRASFYQNACVAPGSHLHFTAKATFAESRDGKKALDEISKSLKRARSNEVSVTVAGVFHIEGRKV